MKRGNHEETIKKYKDILQELRLIGEDHFFNPTEIIRKYHASAVIPSIMKKLKWIEGSGKDFSPTNNFLNLPIEQQNKILLREINKSTKKNYYKQKLKREKKRGLGNMQKFSPPPIKNEKTKDFTLKDFNENIAEAAGLAAELAVKLGKKDISEFVRIVLSLK